MLYRLFTSFCCFGKNYSLYGGKTIDKAKNLGSSWYTGVVTHVLLLVHFCTFIEKHNSIRFSWKVTYGCHFIYDSPHDGRLYSIMGQWPNNTVLFKFKSDVNKKQVALVDLAQFSGIYHQAVKIFQTKLLRSLKFRIVAVYEFLKNKSFKAVVPQNTSFRFVSNIKAKILWKIVKTLRKITYSPKELLVLYPKKVWVLNTKNKKSLIWSFRVLDKILQQLLCFVLEPLVELTLDFNSFGFRKYRSAKMAVGFLRSYFKISSKPHINSFSGKLRNNSCSIRHENEWVLGVDILGFFSIIHSKYLLANLFLPSIGVFSVQHLLFSGALHQLTSTNLLNSTLFPTLVNFTLNNLGVVLNESIYNYTQLNKKSVATEKLRSVNHSYLNILSYVDSLVVLCHSKYMLKAYVLPKIIQFLKERGLELSLKKNKFFCLKGRSKLEFLGYTFRFVKKWWTKSKAINSNYLALYQGKFNFTQVISIIKQIFYKSLSLSAYSLIAKINFILRGWWHYFNIGNCTHHRNIFRNLLYKMAWWWLDRKHSGWKKNRLARVYFWMDKWSCIRMLNPKKYLSQYKSSISEKKRFFHGVFQSKWIYLYFINSKNTASSTLVYNVFYVYKLAHSYHFDKHYVMRWFFKANQFPLNSSLKRLM